MTTAAHAESRLTRALSIHIADSAPPAPSITISNDELCVAMSPSTSWSEVVSQMSEVAFLNEVARLRSLFESPDVPREFETSLGVVIIREPRAAKHAG